MGGSGVPEGGNDPGAGSLPDLHLSAEVENKLLRLAATLWVFWFWERPSHITSTLLLLATFPMAIGDQK